MNPTKFDWLFDTALHAGLLTANYYLFDKEKIIRNYLISLLVTGFLLSQLLKQENQNV